MNGVILFADDKILDINSPEYKLFLSLSKQTPTLGIGTHESLENALNSIGLYQAIVLDWNFSNSYLQNNEDKEDPSVGLIEIPKSNDTLVFLQKHKFYSLVILYSSDAVTIEAEHDTVLRELFPDRIFYRDKSKIAETDQESKEILEQISKWHQMNNERVVPFCWASSINRSLQSLFTRFLYKDSEWLTHYYKMSADSNKVEVEVIDFLQSVLSNELYRDEQLITCIKKLKNDANTNFSKLVEFLRVLYFTEYPDNNQLHTGDIIKKDNKFYIVFTPECDIRKSHEYGIELLQLEEYNFSDSNLKCYEIPKKGKPFLDKITEMKKVSFDVTEKDSLLKLYNQERDKLQKANTPQLLNQPDIAWHYLLSWESNSTNTTAYRINFRNSIYILPPSTNKQEYIYICTLNAPYIHQLIVRYHGFKSRIGVPGISKELNKYLFDATS